MHGGELPQSENPFRHIIIIWIFFWTFLFRWNVEHDMVILARAHTARNNVIRFVFVLQLLQDGNVSLLLESCGAFHFAATWAIEQRTISRRARNTRCITWRVARLYKMPFFFHYYFSLFLLHFSFLFFLRFVALLLAPVLLFCDLCVIYSCSNKQKTQTPLFTWSSSFFFFLSVVSFYFFSWQKLRRRNVIFKMCGGWVDVCGTNITCRFGIRPNDVALHGDSLGFSFLLVRSCCLHSLLMCAPNGKFFISLIYHKTMFRRIQCMIYKFEWTICTCVGNGKRKMLINMFCSWLSVLWDFRHTHAPRRVCRRLPNDSDWGAAVAEIAFGSDGEAALQMTNRFCVLKFVILSVPQLRRRRFHPHSSLYCLFNSHFVKLFRRNTNFG